MMWLFGQVFLLCLAAFLSGGLVSWLLVLRPAADRRVPPVPASVEPMPVLPPVVPEFLAPQAEPVLGTVKGNTRTKRYHTPDSPYFNRTKGDIWFGSVAEAEEAGYSPGVARRRAAV